MWVSTFWVFDSRACFPISSAASCPLRDTFISESGYMWSEAKANKALLTNYQEGHANSLNSVSMRGWNSANGVVSVVHFTVCDLVYVYLMRLKTKKITSALSLFDRLA